MSIKLRIIYVSFSFQYLPLARYDQYGGNEKDSSVQLSMVANWSSFLGSSRPWFINIDFAGLFIVFAEVCTIISAGIQRANDQIGNSNQEGDSYLSTRDNSDLHTCRKLGKCQIHLHGYLLSNSCSSTSVQFSFPNFFFVYSGKQWI